MYLWQQVDWETDNGDTVYRCDLDDNYSILYIPATATLSIDPFITPAVDVSRFDSGGISITPRDDDDFPYISLGYKEAEGVSYCCTCQQDLGICQYYGCRKE